MKPTVHLARVSGIPIGAHWSALATAGLLAYLLAASVLPEARPGETGLVYWTAGLAGAALFLLTLLAHELAHALAARRRGLPVTGVVLWLLGGVTTLPEEPADARTDLAVAVAGPATSLAASGLLGGAAYLWASSGWPPVGTATLAWLSLSNLVIAVFNLLPGAPLDGGRVVRALVWLRTGDRVRGMRAATSAGRGIGTALVVLGLVDFVATLAVAGLWLAMIGWFVRQASGLEGRAGELSRALGKTRVADLMRTDVPVAPAWLSVSRFLSTLGNSRDLAFPVVDFDGRAVGLVSLARLATVPPAYRDEITLGRVCVPVARLVTVAPGDVLAEVLAAGTAGTYLVVEDDRLVGVLDERDVTRAVALATPPPAGRDHAPLQG
jgi:Zn-dependent protease